MNTITYLLKLHEISLYVAIHIRRTVEIARMFLVQRLCPRNAECISLARSSDTTTTLQNEKTYALVRSHGPPLYLTFY